MRLFTKIILIILNTLLCVALILGCYGSKINEGDYWFLGLFTLITPYLIFSTFSFIVFWIFAKRVFTLLGIITFIICWKPILQVIQFRAESFEYKKKDHKIH